jgi:hypothetical protein
LNNGFLKVATVFGTIIAFLSLTTILLSNGFFMTRISDLGAPSNCALRESLSVIRQTHVQLHVLTGMMTTPTVLASRIELCDALLLAISGIRSSLIKDLQGTRQPSAGLH